MNWLLYIPGWYLGQGVVGSIFTSNNKGQAIVFLINWTMLWVWVCWKISGVM